MLLAANAAGIERGQNGRENVLSAELLLSGIPDGMAVQILGSDNGVKVDRQRKLVCVVLDVLPTGRQPIDNETGHTVTDKRRSRADANCGTSSEEDLLERQRTVIIVSQIGTRSRATCCLEQLLPLVLAIVDLDVPWEEFSQVLKQLGAMAVLGVDQQVVFIRQRFARARINWVRPDKANTSEANPSWDSTSLTAGM